MGSCPRQYGTGGVQTSPIDFFVPPQEIKTKERKNICGRREISRTVRMRQGSYTSNISILCVCFSKTISGYKYLCDRNPFYIIDEWQYNHFGFCYNRNQKVIKAGFYRWNWWMLVLLASFLILSLALYSSRMMVLATVLCARVYVCVCITLRLASSGHI